MTSVNRIHIHPLATAAPEQESELEYLRSQNKSLTRALEQQSEVHNRASLEFVERLVGECAALRLELDKTKATAERLQTECETQRQMFEESLSACQQDLATAQATIDRQSKGKGERQSLPEKVTAQRLKQDKNIRGAKTLQAQLDAERRPFPPRVPEQRWRL